MVRETRGKTAMSIDNMFTMVSQHKTDPSLVSLATNLFIQDE